MDIKRRLEGQAFADAAADRSSKPSSAMSSFYVSWPLAWLSLVTWEVFQFGNSLFFRTLSATLTIRSLTVVAALVQDA